MRRVRGVAAVLSAAAVCGLALATPAAVAAHSLVGRFESPLPLTTYLLGAAIAVALSFGFVAVRGARAPEMRRTGTVTVPTALRLMFRAIGLLAWIWVVAQTIVGGSSTADVSSLFLWVYGWVGVAIVSAVIGPVWTWLDPFTTIYDLLAGIGRRLGVAGGREQAAYPSALEKWPAVAGFVFFVWLELAYGGIGTGVVLIGYTVLTVAAMAYFGRDEWRQNGETFGVWFGTLNRLAPLAADDPDARRLVRRPFAAGLFERGWTTGTLVLVAIGAGSILYDGLSQTELWFNVFGAPGLAGATVQLLLFLAAVAGIVLAVAGLVGVAALGAGLVPIAVGYLVAHYFTYLISDGQRIVVAISDPLQQGRDLFGTAFYEPSTDWLPAAVIWTIQLVAVVGGHMLGAWAGHAAASGGAVGGQPADAIRRQVALAALMVALTTTTLWSLGQAVVADPATVGMPGATPDSGARA